MPKIFSYISKGVCILGLISGERCINTNFQLQSQSKNAKWGIKLQTKLIKITKIFMFCYLKS
jgi:hypothetical protein